MLLTSSIQIVHINLHSIIDLIRQNSLFSRERLLPEEKSKGFLYDLQFKLGKRVQSIPSDGQPTKESVQKWFETFVAQPPEVLSVSQEENRLISIRIRLAENLIQIPLKTPWGEPVDIFARNDGTLFIMFQSNRHLDSA